MHDILETLCFFGNLLFAQAVAPFELMVKFMRKRVERGFFGENKCPAGFQSLEDVAKIGAFIRDEMEGPVHQHHIERICPGECLGADERGDILRTGVEHVLAIVHAEEIVKARRMEMADGLARGDADIDDRGILAKMVAYVDALADDGFILRNV